VSFKREVVADLLARGLSERRACRAVGLSRSSYRYVAQRSAQAQQDDERLAEQVVATAHKHRRFGYRRVTALLRRAGERVNHKRVWRIWQQHKLSLPRPRPKKRLAATGRSRAQFPHKATRRGQVWTYDFIFDRTERRQQLKMLVVLDECTRECHKIKVGYRLNSGDVIAVLAELFAAHGAPDYIRSDNGGEFIAAQLMAWLERQGSKTVHITPGHPWENGYAESFNGKFRDECLNGELFSNERQAQVVVEAWRRWYNEGRPHSSLGYHTPNERAKETAAGANGGNAQCYPHWHPPYDDGDRGRGELPTELVGSSGS
jgi:putative transposase